MNNNKFYDHDVANGYKRMGVKPVETIINQLPTLMESIEIVENSDGFVMLTSGSNLQENILTLKLIKNRITNGQ
jgi:hypothetical protein